MASVSPIAVASAGANVAAGAASPAILGGSDDLTMRLFFVGIAMTALVAVLKPSRFFRALLWALVALTLVAAIFWPDIKGYVPMFAQSFHGLSSSAWAWFILVVLIMLVSLVPSPHTGNAMSGPRLGRTPKEKEVQFLIALTKLSQTYGIEIGTETTGQTVLLTMELDKRKDFKYETDNQDRLRSD